jgi:hypothetical protein
VAAISLAVAVSMMLLVTEFRPPVIAGGLKMGDRESGRHCEYLWLMN